MSIVDRRAESGATSVDEKSKFIEQNVRSGFELNLLA